MLTSNAIATLRQRYLQPGEYSWHGLCKRVNDYVTGGASDCLYSLKFRNFLPNSPCLMGAGTDLPQLCACYVLPVGDSMEEIFDAIKEAALVHKSGGGTGFDFSPLRPVGSPVGSTRGVASGPVSFMKIFDAATEQIKQGGRRKGANLGLLNYKHPDILQFIRAKTCEYGLTNFNISVALDEDAFTSEYTRLWDGSTLDTDQILSMIARQAHQNGEPGVIFLDNINRNNSQRVSAVNPCGESPLLPYEPCVLGSINLKHMVNVDRSDINWLKLRHTARTGAYFLDKCVDASAYPLPQVEEMVKKNRKIGLGVMGLADALIMLGLPYDSPQGRALAQEIMAEVDQAAKEESQGRNTAVTACAPTGTLSIIGNCSPGVEPLFSLSYTRTVMDGTVLTELCPFLEESLAKHGVGHFQDLPMSEQRILATANEISWNGHIRMQAAIQKHVDLGISKTINMPQNATVEDVKQAIVLAHELGCKGFTVYREGSREEQVFCKLCET